MIPTRFRAARLATAALLAIAAPAAAQDFRPELQVVQLNDVYRIDAVENGTMGGIGRTVTLVERLKREGRAPVMVFHAGDAIAPSLESRYFAGQQMIDALNFLDNAAPLVFVPGNHEFDERRDSMFVGAVKASRFPWLAGNLTLTTRDSAANRLVGRDTVITTESGMRVGIFTLTFIDSRRDYAAADSAFVRIAEEQIRRLERNRADVIVGLTHLAHETDVAVSKLRRRHPKFVWIAGGHEHYLLHDRMTDSSAAITKGDSNARRVWRVSLGRRGRRAAMQADSIVLDSTVAVDPAYRQQVTERWLAALRERVPFFDATIGRTTTLLDANEETVRNEESAWGNWLADRMRTAFPTVATDAAVLNGGAIRIDDRFGGDIRWEHLARTFGFPTRVGLVRVTGRDLRTRILENSVSGGRGEGRFLQVSGLRVRFDRSRPQGQRILDVRIERPGQNGAAPTWAPLADDSVYTIAVPDYLLGGGDGYPFPQVAQGPIVPHGPDLRLIAFDALASAFAAGRAISPTVEGRLVDETPR